MKNQLLNILTICFLLFFSISAFSQVDLTEKLIAYYPFNGNADDESPNVYDGKVFGAKLTSDRNGSPNSAYIFDGTSYISTSCLIAGNKKSLSFWAKSDLDMSQNKGIIVGTKVPTENRFYLGFNNGSLWIGLGNGGTNSTDVELLASDYQWHHYVLVCNGNVGFVYQDGVQAGYISWTGSINGNIEIGRGGGSDWVYFKGAIDEVRIYSKVLSLNEINALYDNSTSILKKPEISWIIPSTTEFETSNSTFEIKTSINSEKNITKIIVYNGAKVISTDYSIVLTNNYGIFKKNITLGSGSNIITVVAENEDGTTTSDVVTINKTENSDISDVDENIPEIGILNTNRFALIIGNENYIANGGLQSDVIYAINDAQTFRQYAINTLGIPESNIIYTEDATRTEMKKKIDLFISLMDISPEKREFYFYYAGHGYPDENKDAYLMPVDISDDYIEDGIKLSDFYNKLMAKSAKRITVFIDACFSGGGRSNDNLVVARSGIKIVPNENSLTGNLVVFAATSENQVSKPYDEKKHGMFSYFIFEAIKDNYKTITYGELADDLIENVSTYSITVNGTIQIPKVNVGNNVINTWENWKINE